VVSTTIGAEGLDAVHGEQLLLADTADAFAGHVIRVLADRALAAHVADGGRTAVEQQYDWRTVYQAWDEVYH
jgi:glycosyltransferase involved in cell wall biosynthesis